MSEHERQILELISEGQTNKEIAEKVHLIGKTAKNYVSNILSKPELSRRSQAAAYIAQRKSGQEFVH